VRNVSKSNQNPSLEMNGRQENEDAFAKPTGSDTSLRPLNKAQQTPTAKNKN